MDEPRILALCAGYGGLEEVVTRIIGGTVVAFAETHPAAAAVFAAHHPGVPNLGDITEVDWEAVKESLAADGRRRDGRASAMYEREGVVPSESPVIDIITAGFP